ncbi:MAG: hypothetical protein HC784_05595 [Hydrococcus sp. CSU_1_8]|nr:hypothetical protein [Hydrococcus sp. CSU_1_8]
MTDMDVLLNGVLSELEIPIQQKSAIISIDRLPLMNVIPDQFRQRELRFEAGNIVWEYYTTKNGQFEKAKQVLPEDLYFDILEQLLFIHGLPTLRDATSVLPTLRFEPNPHSRLNYEITPQTKIHVALLETIIAWVRLSDWVNMVLKPQPYGMQIRLEDDSGVMVLGDEVTLTLPDHSQQKIEKDLFLSVLAAILEARGIAEAASVRALISLKHEVVVQYLPDLYWIGNYRISPFDARVWDCLDLILCRNVLSI